MWTAANKSRQIREILDVVQADPKWWRHTRMEQNPFAWWVIVNGMAVDARKMPLERYDADSSFFSLWW